MFLCWESFAFIWVFLVAGTCSGQISPPQNLSLRWINDSEPEITWDPPPHLPTSCFYELTRKTNKEPSYYVVEDGSTSLRDLVFMEGGFLSFSIEAVCNGDRSEPALLEISYPDLVKTVDCYVNTSTQGFCYWTPVSNATDLRFFYWLETHFGADGPKQLQECSSYDYTDRVKTGCHLQATALTVVNMVFNATLNNTVVRNTFLRDKMKVQPPAPTMKIVKTEKEFHISWSPPEMLPLSQWNFELSHMKCGKKEGKTFTSGTTSYNLLRAYDCRYCIWIQAQSDSGNSPPSDEQCFDADQDLSLLVYAAVIALIITLAAVTFLVFQRNKLNIFPKVPVPRDFLSDITEDNNESSYRKLYIPAEEEVNCEVMLVVDTPNKK